MDIIAQYAGWIATIIGCMSLLIGVFAKGVKALKKPLSQIKSENRKQSVELEKQSIKIDNLTMDVARLQGDRLNQAYDYYVNRGWCPGAKKRQLQDWYKAYKAAGYNHLADHYIDELISLPEHPPVN